MSLNDSLNDLEKARMSVWDYPISDKYTKMYQAMQDAGPAININDAVDRILPQKRDGKKTNEFALIGDHMDIKWHLRTACEIIPLGEEFLKKPWSWGCQKGSILKNQLDDA